MVTYTCAVCGTTETASDARRLDEFWISEPDDTPVRGGSIGEPRRYCGQGCAHEAYSTGDRTGRGAPIPAVGPPAPAASVTSLAESLRPLATWFNRHAESPRFLALLSPT